MLQGLANTGNTCSINTLIQCLGHCPAFLDLILNKEYTISKKPHAQFSICEELKLILKQMWVDNHSLVPARFLKAFYESIGDLYNPGEQFDFTEMWMLLLNNLLEETHQKDYKSILLTERNYEIPILNYLHKKSLKTWSIFNKSTLSPFADLLHGIQIQQIECNKCHHLYHNLEPFSFTYIELKSSGLKENIEYFLQKEVITDWSCDNCKDKNAEKVMRFWKLPKIWVIILKRFDNQTKIHSPIDISPEFHFNEICNDTIVKYKLTAIANHYGSLHGGHYNAICLNPDNQWVGYDDIHVQKIDSIIPHLQQNRNAYALFYSQF